MGFLGIYCFRDDRPLNHCFVDTHSHVRAVNRMSLATLQLVVLFFPTCHTQGYQKEKECYFPQSVNSGEAQRICLGISFLQQVSSRKIRLFSSNDILMVDDIFPSVSRIPCRLEVLLSLPENTKWGGRKWCFGTWHFSEGLCCHIL